MAQVAMHILILLVTQPSLLMFLLEIIHDVVKDETEDTPLILAIKNFTSLLGLSDRMTGDSPINLQVIKLLIEFGMFYL